MAGVAAFFFMQHTKKELHAMIGTETLSIPELEAERTVSDELGAKGSFRKATEVVGAAHPRPEGVLTSELGKHECVWYRYTVEREYEHVEYRDGDRRTSRRTEKMTDHASNAGFAVIDEAGRTIGVDPSGERLDSPEQVVDRFEPAESGRDSVELFGIKLPSFGGGNRTIGYKYKEWIVRPGQRLYILGEVHDRIGPLVIGRPSEDGYFIVSTRSEGELRRSRETRHKFLALGTVAGVVIGTGLVVAQVVS
ncbi:hypothetical protein GCM10009676_33110 [Prauserella halophila]|uniref:RING-type E3 ubiquitin transferase n=1 Tax=Prauserella halophila TaxID=185641 RepID=A0ABP4GZ57_9PSEU